jgi:hypothetical protein
VVENFARSRAGYVGTYLKNGEEERRVEEGGHGGIQAGSLRESHMEEDLVKKIVRVSNESIKMVGRGEKRKRRKEKRSKRRKERKGEGRGKRKV